MKLQLALCNEVLEHLPFEQQCELAAALGYQGLEIAPFTLAPDPMALTAADGRAWAKTAADHGLAICGLHWLLSRPEGLSITTADDAVRRRTEALLERLIDVGEASGARVMVHGSPRQRAPDPGQPVADALARATEVWARLAERARAAGLVYCIEPLASTATPVVNTLAQAAAIVDAVGSPALRTMLDLAAGSRAESEPVDVVLRRHLASGHVAHVQLNDRNRRGPGQGDTPVAPVLRVLRDGGYAGWVSVEPFEYHPDPVACAAFSAGHVQGLWNAIAPLPSC